MRSNKMVRSRVLRVAAFAVVSATVVAACGSREPSASGDRDRNAQSRGSQLFLTTAIDGVARNKIGDVTITEPFNVVRGRQADGSTLIANVSSTVDKSGISTKYTVARLDANGDFDFSFGSNSLRTIALKEAFAPYPTITSDGSILVPYSDLQGGFNNTANHLARYNAITGERDEGFGSNGSIDVSPISLNGPASVVTDNAGSTYLIGLDPATTDTVLERVTDKGPDLSFGTDGLVSLEQPQFTGLGAGEGVICSRPALALSDAGTVVTLDSCLIVRSVTDETGQTTNETRRILTKRSFDNRGAEIGTTDFIAVDEQSGGFSKSTSAELIVPAIMDIQRGIGESADVWFVTLSAGSSRFFVRLSSEFVKVISGPDGVSSKLAESVSGAGPGNVHSLLHATYVDAPQPRFVGISLNADSGSTELETGPYFADADIAESQVSVAIGELPLVTHDVTSAAFVKNGVFTNLSASGITAFAGDRQRVGGRSGYMTIGADGVSTSGAANPMLTSPLNGEVFNPDVFRVPNLFPATDGTFYTFGFQWDRSDAGEREFLVNYFIEHFDASGRSLDKQTIVASNFSPVFWRGSTVVEFDGADSFYISGFKGEDIGVAKLSLAARGFDEKYGMKGFAPYPRLAASGETDFMWFGATLQVNSDGSVDTLASQWGGEANQPNQMPLTITTLRFAPNGSVDESAPRFSASVPDVVACMCLDDMRRLEVGHAAVVDHAGRLLVPIPKLTWGDVNRNAGPFIATAYETHTTPAKPLATLVGGGVLRYLRDGTLDTTFGKDGVGGAPLALLGSNAPISQPRLAFDADENIFMTFTGIEMTYVDHGDKQVRPQLDGEFAYAVMLNASGLPMNFTPRKPDPATQRLADFLGESQAQTGAAQSSAAPSPSGAVAAPPGGSADVVIPADVVQTNRGKTPVITVTGTPFDRTIDVRWSVPESLVKANPSYTVTASPGNQKCTTSTTSCVFKKLDPWTSYTFSIKTVTAASTSTPESLPSSPVKPVRIVKRNSTTDLTKLITPASAGKPTWKTKGACKLSGDKRKLIASKDAGLCSLTLSTGKSGKTPKTTRSITVVVRAVAS